MKLWRFLVFFAAVSLWSADPYTAAERRHWAFQPRKQIAVPQVPDATGWVRTPVDAFILTRLREKGIAPSPQADPRTLIRRLYLDVTGLPPTPEEVEQFAGEPSGAAYEKLVDKLLASTAYAERQAQHWLDVVRYAESDGFEYDTYRPDAWRYRDYVIYSFRDDKSYNRFVEEQLAGDELDAANHELRVAAGFQRLGSLRKNAGNQEVASSRNEVLVEMTNIVGSAFLGMTLGCARCHDHKFDPIRQRDYYRVQAYFAAAHEKDIPLVSESLQAEWKAKTDSLKQRIKEMTEASKKLHGATLEEKKKEIAGLEAQLPAPLPALFSVADDATRATPIHVLARGDWTKKGEAVGMMPPGILLPSDSQSELPASIDSPRRRLAEWLTDSSHPLTARVMVNRIWQMHFGTGLVATPNDFGRMGSRPTHPELLDWLANRFVEGGWKLKPLHRVILMSSTYRQASEREMPEGAREADPGNKLLWRYDRRRLDAEQIRDSILAVAGALNRKEGGPSVTVPLQPELLPLLYKPSQWKVTEDEKEHFRRSIYLMAKRNMRLPFLEVFDAPDRLVSCARRESSTHPPQALELLNGEFTNQMARLFARRIDQESKGQREAMVDRAFRIATGRPPNAPERRLALEYLNTQPTSEFALAVLNLNAFLYMN